MAVPPSIVRKAGVLISGAVIAAAGLVALAPAPAQADTVTLSPVEDTYVNQGAPSANFGSASSLSSRGTPGAISYLRFALPSAPAGSVLAGVSLRIRSSSDPAATSSDNHTVALTTSAWSESALTWNTRATVTGPQVGTVGPVTALNSVVATALDPAGIAPILGGTVSLAVTSSGADSLYFWSSNHVTASYRPALVLTFGPAASPTSTTPVTTTTTTDPTTTTTSTTTTTTTTEVTTTTEATTTTTGPASGPQAPTGLVAAGPTALTLADPPRIALLNQQVSSLAGAVRVAPDDPRLTYRGAADFAFGASYPDTLMYQPSSRYPHAYGSQTAYAVEFTTNAAVFEIFFKQKPSGMFRLAINGRRTTALPMGTGATISAGLYLLRFDLGSSGVQRRITLDLVSVPFGGVNIPPGTSLTKVTSTPARWAVLGDSISGGSDANAGYAQGTWVGRFGLLTGWTDAFNQSLGGTGFVNPGTSAVFGARVDGDVVAYDPQKVVVWGGFNDLSSSQSVIASAAGSVVSRIRSGLPGATVYLVGCWSPTGSPGSSLRATDATLRGIALARGVPFVSPITGTVLDATGAVVAELGPWITGTGTNAAPRGDGNADVYLGPDRVHPSDAGHSHIASKLAAAVAAIEGTTPAGSGVSLTWSPSAGLDGPAGGYEVHRSSVAGFTPTSATLIGTTADTTFVAPADDTGTFWYRLVAFDGSGARSTPSSAVSATVVDDTSYVSGQRVEIPSVVSLTPTADTYVNQSAATVNYGTSSSLGARGVTSAVAYLSFAIPAAPAGKTLTAATLTIRTNNDAAGGSVDSFAIRLTSASWSETGMTWNTRAAVNGATVGTLTGPVAVNTTYTATLAPSSLAGLAGATTLVVASSSASTDSLYFWSRNYATAAGRPTLTLSYD